MKKRRLFIASFLISLLNISNTNLICCGYKKPVVNKKTDSDFTNKKPDSNYIIDLNKNYQSNCQEISAHKNHLNKFVTNSLKRKLTIKEEQLCQKLNLALSSAYSQSSLAKFDNFINHKTFFSFEQLVETIDAHNRKFNNLYVDLPFEAIADITYKNKEAF